MIDLDAPIKEVTVYADRALVSRQGSINLEAGEHELRVNNLPQLLRDSLRAAGYRGYIALEYEAEAEPKTAIPGHIEALSKLMG